MKDKMKAFTPYMAVASRLLLAQIFVISGAGMLIEPASTLGLMSAKGLPASPFLVACIGLFELVAATGLIVGWKARWAAIGLMAFTVVASLLFHDFWAVPVAQQFMQQLLFMKNMAVAGGLLFIVAIGAGPSSLDKR
jgi:putative oxidoreductase